MPGKAYLNVRDQLGCCGIWCGSCVVGNGALGELSRKYDRVITDYGIDDWGLREVDYDALMVGLKGVACVSVCVGCQKGGGNESCKVRPCARARSVADCTECSRRAGCGHAGERDKVREGATKAGMRVKEGSGDTTRLIEGWEAKMKCRWPDIVLFDS